MLKTRPTDIRVNEVTSRIRTKMRRWGITLSFLAARLSVSRQYAWQIVHYSTAISLQRATEIEAEVDRIVADRAHMQTLGERLRAARLSAGMTLKQAANLIGYSWVGVERWEKNLCLPKPGVLLHLLNLYRTAGGAIAEPHLAFSQTSHQYRRIADVAFTSTDARTIPL
jgi:DNA-binding transcriptional regulator YiaG